MKIIAIFIILIINILKINSVSCFLNVVNEQMHVAVVNISRCQNMGRHSFVYDTNLGIYNRTHQFYTGNITLKTEINNNQKFRIVGWSKPKGSNEWTIQVDASMKACDSINRFVKEILIEMFAAADSVYECPIKPRAYFVNNFIIDMEKFTNSPKVAYGDFKLQLQLISTKNRKRILEGCVLFQFLVSPEKFTFY
ncbi:uncharacterized protein LOC142333412 [Lycorma delicatula]|uniref:uncharacterized protein LOC142333412 n=1 Tax=Lycorma delicatula TaxID=130591 RepID=UPI003F516D9B